MKPGPVEAQLKTLREARWRELHPEASPKPVSSKPVDTCPPEDIRSVDIKPVDTQVDTSVDKPRVVKNAAYWRERKRAQRAAKKLTASSSAA